MDDLERALQHAGDAAESTLASGVEMVVRKFGQALSRRGVTPIDPTGEPFDPTFHEAIQQVDDPDVPHNTVHQVFQKGYMLHERLLRPALVVVAQGGAPRSLAPEPDAEDEASEADAEALEGAEAPSEPAESSATDGQEDSAQLSLEDAPSGSDNEVAGDEPNPTRTRSSRPKQAKCPRSSVSTWERRTAVLLSPSTGKLLSSRIARQPNPRLRSSLSLNRVSASSGSSRSARRSPTRSTPRWP